MNKLFIGVFMSVLFFSCSKDDDEATVVIADFTATVSGESPNAKVTIVNNSKDASSYEWTFGEGADISTSTESGPLEIEVDKAGDFEITLVAKNGAQEKEVTKTVSIDGFTAVESFSDIEFALKANDEAFGRFFSFTTGEIYKDSEINEENGADIHLGFGSMSYVMYFFQSPDHNNFDVPNATATKVMNYQSEPAITVEAFSTMADNELLADLEIEDKNDSFGNGSIPGIVLFETSTGRKGAIHTKAVNSDRLLVDIKVEKY